jgi:tetratricopeptide (TPR) repeat protein
VERQPDRPAFWTDLGTAQEQLGNFTEAEAAFTRAIEADPEYLPAMAQLGSLQQRRGHNADAIATFDRLLALDPHRPSVLFLKAEAHRLAGDLPSAIDAFKRSLELDPDDERVLIGLAAAYFQGGDRGAATGAVARGLAARPDSFWFRSLKLRLCAVGRACPASLEEAELLFRSRPTAFAAESLAMTFANHGDFAAAHRWQTAAIAALETSGDSADLARTRELAYREHRLDVPTFRPEEFSASRVPVSGPN